MGIPLMKEGELLSPTYSEWVRSQCCAICGRRPRNEQHHHPSRGAAGVTNDVRSMPICREDHIRCEGATVLIGGKRMPPIPAEEQERIVGQTFLRFVLTARWHEVEQVMRDIKRHRESRVFVELVPE